MFDNGWSDIHKILATWLQKPTQVRYHLQFIFTVYGFVVVRYIIYGDKYYFDPFGKIHIDGELSW